MPSLVDFTGLSWARPSAQVGGPASFDFVSDGLTRTAHYIGNDEDPAYAWVWLDGGNSALGTEILGNLTPASDEIFVAPDGLTHQDGTSTWIKRWTPEPLVRHASASEATDLIMLLDLVAEIHTRWPSATTLFCAGYSGGAGLVMEQACIGSPYIFDGFFVFKRPLHEIQVDGDGRAVMEVPLRPLMLWMAENDDEHNNAEDHVGRAATALAYMRTYTGRRFSDPSLSYLTVSGRSLVRRSYNHTRDYVYIHEIRGDHSWVEGLEVIARRFLRRPE